MIPLRDTIPSRRFPFSTIGLIIINVVVFLYQRSLGEAAEGFIKVFGLVPVAVAEGFRRGDVIAAALPFVSSVFLHGGWLHLIGNMWFLWIFGDNVEDKLGRGRFLIFYLFCGVGAAAVQMYASPLSGIPIIGASGAIAGVLGSYFLLFPKAKVLTLLPIFFFLTTVEIPAVLFLGLWFVLQILNGTLSVAGGSEGGVAWWAHVGGFVAGMLLVFPFRKYR
ncbi:MAG: rhomboid family intramembrane serine protease [Ignavibacteriales bacterium]|nr:rhomboid family intramembrane serine protease [Ignavibacteriales bacterium]